MVKTEVERELNRETIARLDKMLAAAKIRLAERKQEFEAAQKALGTNGYTCATNETLEGFFELTASTAKFTLNLNP